MKCLLAITATLFLAGCDDQEVPPSGYKCIWENTLVCKMESWGKWDCKDEFPNFVLQCAKNANPLSDEEGEDLVKQCELTGRNIYCVWNRYGEHLQ